MENKITIALPKGKLGVQAIDLLAKIGLPREGLETESRTLLFEYAEEKIQYIICRPTDIPTYVEYGAADLGIVGKDTIVEAGADVFELVDLKFGKCSFVVAVPEFMLGKYSKQGKFDLQSLNNSRVATKFPKVASDFFAGHGLQVKVIKLHGNIELAPRVGLAEMIVDIVSTGRTLRENGLVAVQDIFQATARLIANRVCYRMKYDRLNEISLKLRRILAEGDANNA